MIELFLDKYLKKSKKRISNAKDRLCTDRHRNSNFFYLKKKYTNFFILRANDEPYEL